MYAIVWYVGPEAPEGEWNIERNRDGDYPTFEDALAEVKRRSDCKQDNAGSYFVFTGGHSMTRVYLN